MTRDEIIETQCRILNDGVQTSYIRKNKRHRILVFFRWTSLPWNAEVRTRHVAWIDSRNENIRDAFVEYCAENEREMQAYCQKRGSGLTADQVAHKACCVRLLAMLASADPDGLFDDLTLD